MKALDSPQVMHAAVMASFNSFNDAADGRVLWRTDKVGSATYLLVQSPVKPDFHHIIDQYGRPDADEKWDCMDYSDFIGGISDGQIWRFRLRANPVQSVSSLSGGSRGKVVAHVTAEQQLEWLRSRSDLLGFSISDESGSDTAEVVQRDIRRFQRNGKPVTLSSVTFEGLLRVTEGETFRRALTAGIGRAKAYGCGLMTLARP